MKTILTSSLLATMLVMTISGCGSSSSTKKVYLNGNESNNTAHQVGTSSTDSGSRDDAIQTTNNTQNIERVAMNIGATTVQNLHLSTDTIDYEALSISGTGSSNFIILDKDVYPKNDIVNGDYNVIIHAKAIGGTETVDKELIIEVTGSSLDPVVENTTDTTDTNTPIQTSTPGVIVIGTNEWLKLNGSEITFSQATEECTKIGAHLPTEKEFELNINSLKSNPSFGYSTHKGMQGLVLWSSETGKNAFFINELDATDNYASSELRDVSKGETSQFTCIK